MQWHRIKLLLVEHEQLLKQQGYDYMAGDEIVQTQISVVRTNCMDCLDRTNVVQSEIAQFILEDQLKRIGILGALQHLADLSEFDSVFKNGKATFYSCALILNILHSLGRQCRRYKHPVLGDWCS